MGNEKCENVLKRVHSEDTTPEKKRKIDDEGIMAEKYFVKSYFFQKLLSIYFLKVLEPLMKFWRIRRFSNFTL